MRKLMFVALITLIAAPMAFAATATVPNNQIQANVAKNCTIAWGTLNFGAYDPLAANAAAGSNLTNSATTITVTCTKKTPFTVGLSDGANPVAVGGQRRMLNGSYAGEYLNYELYLDNAFSTRWDALAGTNFWTVAAASGVATPNTHVVYGSVPKGQDAAEGSFLDTVTATVNF